MSRILRPTTIIPANLYVERAADRQLRQIIEDMGRPGYVLVARQMGKTNLLLSMKQKHEAAGDIVVYIDLSNRFNSARSCLRNVIDVIIETNNSSIGHLEERIYKDREQINVEPSTEFSRHIRLILKNNEEKKLIIVLDEIDSLINSGYSDVILSQIRSTYFMRVNFPEYNRLTYVLSGVAEPTDLIKDKNISPFNIGEKIYLEDFSLEECKELNKNSKLNLNDECMESIFSWSSGHPRMTWDILSEIEENIGRVHNVTPSFIDEVVKKLYLKDFDRPPVDHMRVLLEDDAQLRNALISIRYGKGGSVDERVRGRLYLSGITSSPAANLRVKNRIIDESLSDSWLAQATKAGADPLTIAAEHFAGRRYELVIKTLRAYEGEDGIIPASLKLQLGMALYYTDKFEEAATLLSEVKDSLRGDMRTMALYYLGGALQRDGKYDDSTPYLEEASVKGTGNFALSARVLLAASYYWSPVSDAAERTLQLREEILATLKAEEASDPHARKILTDSVYNLAVAASQAGEETASTSYFNAAIRLAPSYMLPTIMITAAGLSSDVNQKIKFTTNAVETMIEQNLKYSIDGDETLAFREPTLAAIISSLHSPYQEDLLQIVLNYAKTLYSGSETNCSIMIKMVELLEDTNVSNLWPILESIENKYKSEIKSKDRLTLFRMIANNSHDNKEKRREEYFEFIKNNENVEISINDVMFIASTVHDLWLHKKLEELIDVVNIAEQKSIKFKNSLWFPSIILFRMQAFVVKKRYEEAKYSAKEILDIIEEIKKTNYKDESKKDIDNYIKNLTTHANSVILINSPDPYRHIGRNQKITVVNVDGTSERIVKFKFVEQEIRMGKLKVLSHTQSKN